MTLANPLIAANIFGVPLALDAAKARVICASLGPRLLGLQTDGLQLANFPEAGKEHEDRRAGSLIADETYQRAVRHENYSVFQGVAVIPVLGTLARRGSYVGASSGVTTYEGIGAQIRAAADDPAVKAIALEIDSFGGEAAGIFDLAETIRAVRELKPVHAFIADYALSAGYAIASQADHITVPPFGQAGSIGVVMLHADYSGHLDKEGVTVSLIHSGKHKVDGNPYQPLPDDVRGVLQSEGDAMWAEFAANVGLGRRDRLDQAGAIATQAQVFTGAEAVRAGLADAVGEARTAFTSFVEQVNSGALPGLEMGGGAPAASAAHGGGHASGGGNSPQTTQEKTEMENETQTAASSVVTTPAGAAHGTPDAETIRAQERDRAAKITSKAASAGLSSEFAAELVASGVSLEVAYEKILDKKAEQAADGGDTINPTISVGADSGERMAQGMERALALRAGLDGGERNEFAGMTLREMARHSLVMAGVPIPVGGGLAMVGAAFTAGGTGMHGTSDFASVLSNVANKSMLRGFNEQPESFTRFTRTGTLTDFKASTRVGVDAFPSLREVAPGAEFKHASFGDNAETAILATYGEIFAISRQAILNDDLDAFTRIPANMGRAARRTVGDLVFAVLIDNPKMGDEKSLFHAAHKNLANTAAQPTELGINAGITAMAKQKDRGGKAQLNIAPAFLLAAPELRSRVLQSLNSDHAPDNSDAKGTKQAFAYNTVKDAAEPIFDARLSNGNGPHPWFLVADPAMYDGIEVSYLDGNPEPFLDQQTGWGVDGTEFKVRIDAAATPLAWQSLYKNAGSN